MDFEINRLLMNISRRDTASLEILYDKLKNGIYLYALSLLDSRTAAEDVLQDTFVRVFTLAHTHAPEKDGKAWIFTIARNLCLDRLKSSEGSVQPLEEGGEKQPNFAECDFVSDLELKDALLRLEKKSRDIVLLHLAAGFRFREIAALLGEKQNSVQWTYYSAVRKLSSYYEVMQAKGAEPNETKQ